MANGTTFDDVFLNVSTTPRPIQPPSAGSICVGLLLLLMVLVTLTGNILTISAFVSNVVLRQKPSNLLLLSLSCCDLIVGATGLPVAAIHTGFGYWPLGKAMCVICAFFSVIGVSAGMYTVTAISLDRYFLVSREYPAYLKLQSCRNVKLTIAAAWTMAILISSCEVILWISGDYSSVDYSRECLSPVRSDPRFIIIIFLLLFVIPFLVMFISTVRFSVLLRRLLQKQTRAGGPSIGAVNKKLNSEKVSSPAFSSTRNSESRSEIETTEISCSPSSHQSPPASTVGIIKSHRPVGRKTLDACGKKKSFFDMGDGGTLIARAKARRRYVKPAVRLAILLGAFTLCTLPYPIFLVVSKGSDCEDCLIRQIRNHLSNLLLSNSGLNPFLYAVMHRKIRHFFKMKLTSPCNGKC